MQVYASLAPRTGSPSAAAIVGWMMTAATIEASASARERMSMSLQNSRNGSVRRAAMLVMVQGKFHPWMGLAVPILAGHPREAAERNQLDLAARYEEGDRDAAATLYSLVANCKGSEVAAVRSGAAEGYASLAAQARESANQRSGLAKAKALAFIDLLDESEA